MSKFFLFSFIWILLQQPAVKLESIKWINGSSDCSKDQDEQIQVVRYDSNTWILRQNKCINYEAPFMFLFLGKDKALLMDTGATQNADSFPIKHVVNQLIRIWEKKHKRKLELIVAHTHSHSDHWMGDVQFKNLPHTTVVGLSEQDVQQFFQLKSWPDQTAVFDLGGRTMDVIPIPGHDKTSIALYDRQSRILLTGDSFYPGRLYVRDWTAFKKSIQRLVDFTAHHQISYLVGNHIEMSDQPGIDYPTGATWHPHEHTLPLKVSELRLLNNALIELGDQPAYKVFNDFIIVPK